jgi:hypothetical protein
MAGRQKRVPPLRINLRPFRYSPTRIQQIIDATKVGLPSTTPKPVKWPQRRAGDQSSVTLVEMMHEHPRADSLEYQLDVAVWNWEAAQQEEERRPACERPKKNIAWHEFVLRLADIFENIFERRATANPTLKNGISVIDTPFVRFAQAAMKPLGQTITGNTLREIL